MKGVILGGGVCIKWRSFCFGGWVEIGNGDFVYCGRAVDGFSDSQCHYTVIG